MFYILPLEILQCEILTRLDNISLLCLRVALCQCKLPDTLSMSSQEEVVSHGLSLTKYFDNFKLLNTFDISWQAAKYGQLEILEYVEQRQYDHSDYAAMNAADSGHLDCLKYIQEHNYLMDEVTVSAACGGHLDCLIYAANYDELQSWLIRVVAFTPHTHIIDYLISNGQELEVECMDNVIEFNQLAMVKFLDERDCPSDGLEVVTAATYGQLAIMQYLIGKDYPLVKQACEAAAKHGNLDCLRYLHENGCPWDDYTTYEAIRKDQLECLQYAFEHGCPLYDGWAIAASTGRRCLSFLYEQGLLK